MKNIFRSPLLYTILTLGACNSFDQAAFDEGFNTDDAKAYEVPAKLPSSEEQFSVLLHGEEKNEWLAQEFYLEGLLGNQDCRLDDQMILRADLTYLFDGGSMSCGGSDVSTRSGVYRQDYAQGRLIFDEGTSDEVIVNVSGLDEGVIALSGEVDVFGVPMTIKGVYTVE